MIKKRQNFSSAPVLASNNWQSIVGGLAAANNAANLCSGYSHPDDAWSTLTTSIGNNADFIEVNQ